MPKPRSQLSRIVYREEKPVEVTHETSGGYDSTGEPTTSTNTFNANLAFIPAGKNRYQDADGETPLKSEPVAFMREPEIEKLDPTTGEKITEGDIIRRLDDDGTTYEVSGTDKDSSNAWKFELEEKDFN